MMEMPGIGPVISWSERYADLLTNAADEGRKYCQYKMDPSFVRYLGIYKSEVLISVKITSILWEFVLTICLTCN